MIYNDESPSLILIRSWSFYLFVRLMCWCVRHATLEMFHFHLPDSDGFGADDGRLSMCLYRYNNGGVMAALPLSRLLSSLEKG